MNHKETCESSPSHTVRNTVKQRCHSNARAPS